MCFCGNAFPGQRAEVTDEAPGELAERLLRLALIAAGGRMRDDMTIAVIGVWENSAEQGA